jgi:hypothetical protein
MNTHKRTAGLVGAFFLISNVVFLLGAFVFVEPILNDPDYLALVSENRTQVVFGALLEMTNAVAYIGIAVLMFSVLRQRFASLALWYVCFRIIEFVMQTLSDLGALALLNVSEEFVRAGAPEASPYQALGALLLAERAWAFQMVTISLVLGAVMFYFMLYKTRLIPRFISVWGLVAAAAVIATALMDMFGIEPGSLEFLGVLMLLNELFLGVWLIVKGFDSSAIGVLRSAEGTA